MDDQHILARPERRQLVQGLAASAVCSALAWPGRAQETRPRPPLKCGIGVHNLLNWPEVERVGNRPRYVWPPFQGPSYKITAAETHKLRKAGFDFIRLTVDPSIFIAAEPSQQGELERHVMSVVQQFLMADLDVIVDLHPVAVNPDLGPEILVLDATAPAFLAYTALVGQMATLLRQLPPSRVALELFNEPPLPSLRDAPRWQGMLEVLHARARQATSDLLLVIGGVQWNSAQGLMALDLAPLRTSNVIYTFHYYDPHAFTHQGVEGQDTAWLGGLAWPTNVPNIEHQQVQAFARIDAAHLDDRARNEARAETAHYLAQLRRNPPGSQQIASDFASVAQWATNHAIAPDRVLLGEFGCVSAAWGESIDASRLHWIETVRRNCERAGFAWSFWGYKGYGGMTLVRDDGSFNPSILGALGLSGRG